MHSRNKHTVIRRFDPSDAKDVSYLISQALKEINRKDYSAQVIQNLIEAYSPDNIVQKSYKMMMYVAVVDGQIHGTGSLKENVIIGLFVDPACMRQGIGTQLINYIEDIAQQNGITQIFVGSSITAFDFYRHCGYQFVRDEESQKYGLVKVMEKTLS